ncbi:hypothetical protein HNP89_001824 [Methanococcus maripaludis]|uniref:Cyclophilin-like domain-containing protein n=1 Tax=Methanococcus maripaludis TaxID=39152 RepID=A0A7J9P1P2_METMI|nr:cyclophilin-like fold protein [Methanococcus maripaludis]MBA2853848.1 hypothetical protein [Methanococcus maripaludis]
MATVSPKNIVLVLFSAIIMAIFAVNYSSTELINEGPSGEEVMKKEISIREIKNGTRINMYINNKTIPGILNNGKPAKELIGRLPYTIHASKYDFDICGVMAKPLSFTDEDLVPGWKNGDIDFTTQGNYFTILFDNEENCYGEFVNLGVIDCDPAIIAEINGSFDILIELAD